MEELRKQAEHMRNRLRGYLDQPDHPKAQALVREVENLILDIRGQKHPLSIENRIKGIIRQLEGFADDIVMDFQHRDELIRHSNDMRAAARSLS